MSSSLDVGVFSHALSPIINTIIESAGPYFLTQSPRFLVPMDQVHNQPRFTVNQFAALISFVVSREDRPACIHYIQRHLCAQTRGLLLRVAQGKPVRGPLVRSRLVVCVMVGWMSFYHDRTCRLAHRFVTSLENVLYAEEIRHAIVPGQLTLHRVSLDTQSGHVFRFDNLPLFVDDQRPSDSPPVFMD